MFNRLNVLIDTINKQAIVISQLTMENKRLREMYNSKTISQLELKFNKKPELKKFIEDFLKED